MLNQFARAVYIQYKICLFSRSPVDLPYSFSVLGVMVSAIVLIRGYFIANMPNSPDINLSTSLFASLSYVAIFGIGLYMLLGLKRAANRWHKVFTAFIGTKLFLIVVFLPWIILLQKTALGFLMGLMQEIWMYAVGGYILYRSIGIRIFPGVLLVLLLEMIASIPTLMQLSQQLRMVE